MESLLYRWYRRFLNSVVRKIKNTNSIELHGESKLSKTAVIKGLTAKGILEVGDNCKIVNNVMIIAENKVSIGRYTSISGPNTDIINGINPIRIGSFTSIARSVTIQEFNHNMKSLSTFHMNQNVFDRSRQKDIYSNGEIIIGNDVWIGSQCVILSGAKIGDGVVVAANSVVRGDVPPYAIIGGTPAKIIGWRFNPEVIDYLTKLRWWDKSDEEIRMNSQLFNDEVTIDKLAKWKTISSNFI